MKANLTEAIVLNRVKGSSGFNVSRRKIERMSNESLVMSFKSLSDYDKAEIMRNVQGTFNMAALRQHMVNWLEKYGSLL